MTFYFYCHESETFRRRIFLFSKYIKLESLKSAIPLYPLSLSAWADMTKFHRQGSLNNRNWFLTALKAWKSKIKVPVNSVFSKSSLPGLWKVTFFLWPHTTFPWYVNACGRKREKFLCPPLIRRTILLDQIPTYDFTVS